MYKAELDSTPFSSFHERQQDVKYEQWSTARELDAYVSFPKLNEDDAGASPSIMNTNVNSLKQTQLQHEVIIQV